MLLNVSRSRKSSAGGAGTQSPRGKGLSRVPRGGGKGGQRSGCAVSQDGEPSGECDRVPPAGYLSQSRPPGDPSASELRSHLLQARASQNCCDLTIQVHLSVCPTKPQIFPEHSLPTRCFSRHRGQHARHSDLPTWSQGHLWSKATWSGRPGGGGYHQGHKGVRGKRQDVRAAALLEELEGKQDLEDEVRGAEVLMAGRRGSTGPPRPFVRIRILTQLRGKPLATCEQGGADEIYFPKRSPPRCCGRSQGTRVEADGSLSRPPCFRVESRSYLAF